MKGTLQSESKRLTKDAEMPEVTKSGKGSGRAAAEQSSSRVMRLLYEPPRSALYLALRNPRHD
jgi:hypothetical protein